MCVYINPVKRNCTPAIPKDIKTLFNYDIVKKCGENDIWEFNSSRINNPRVIIPLNDTELLEVKYKKDNNSYLLSRHDEENDDVGEQIEVNNITELATTIRNIFKK